MRSIITALLALCLCGCADHDAVQQGPVDLAELADHYVSAHFAVEDFAPQRRQAMVTYGQILETLPGAGVRKATQEDRIAYAARVCLAETMGPQSTAAAESVQDAVHIDSRRLIAHQMRVSNLPAIMPGQACDDAYRLRI